MPLKQSLLMRSPSNHYELVSVGSRRVPITLDWDHYRVAYLIHEYDSSEHKSSRIASNQPPLTQARDSTINFVLWKGMGDFLHCCISVYCLRQRLRNDQSRCDTWSELHTHRAGAATHLSLSCFDTLCSSVLPVIDAQWRILSATRLRSGCLRL